MRITVVHSSHNVSIIISQCVRTIERFWWLSPSVTIAATEHKSYDFVYRLSVSQYQYLDVCSERLERLWGLSPKYL